MKVYVQGVICIDITYFIDATLSDLVASLANGEAMHLELDVVKNLTNSYP